MAPTLVTKAYSEADFIPLEEHATQTPSTFFSLTPVLHLHCPQAKIRLSQDVYRSQPVFSALDPAQDGDIVVVSRIDVWVTSKFLGLYQASSSKGVQIEYPSIIVHGQQGDSIMLELSMPLEDDDDFAQINIVPDGVAATTDTATTNGHGSTHSSATALYKAIEACQELNPSPVEDDDDDLDMPSFPGSGGWITSENADQYLDEDGQFKPPAEWTNGLGPGAGQTRTAPDDDEDEATKWQRSA